MKKLILNILLWIGALLCVPFYCILILVMDTIVIFSSVYENLIDLLFKVYDKHPSWYSDKLRKILIYFSL